MEQEDLKKKIKEIVEIVKICPVNLQEKCFEVLLQFELSSRKAIAPHGEEKSHLEINVHDGASSVPPEILKRIKAFCGQYGPTLEMILKVYAINDSGNVSIEATDLKTKKNSQQQRRLALLIGVRHQFEEGSFDVPTEELRELCVTYGVYDAPNFKANIKNSKEIFAGQNKLSPKGKKEAADLIKELAT